MANHEVVSNALGGATDTHRGDISNAPTNPNLNGANPTTGATFYEGQKVNVQISTTDLLAGGYTQVQFYVAVDDSLKELPPRFLTTGIAVHPDSKPLTQTVTSDSDYSIDVVIYGRAPDSATWNVDVNNPGDSSVTELFFPANIEYSTLNPVLYIPWLGYQFLPPGNQNPPKLSNSLHIKDYKVYDASGAPVSKQFSALIQPAADGELTDLSGLHFFDANKTEIKPVDTGKTKLWIDSDASGSFEFYVSADTSSNDAVLASLAMNIGTQTVDLPQLVIADPDNIAFDAQTPSPAIDGAGSTYTVNSRPIGVIVPHEAIGSIQEGDTLFLIVNNTLLPNTGQKYNQNTEYLVAGNLPFFHISPSLLKMSDEGAQNTLSYLILREKNKPVKSSEFNFKAQTGDLSGGVNPPYPVDRDYTPLVVKGYAPNSKLGADDVRNGLTAIIDWTGWQKAPPKAGDQFVLLGFIVGYDRNQNQSFPTIQVTSREVTQDDIDNKGYIEVPVPPQPLYGWGDSSDGDHSYVIFQYVVDPKAAKPEYSDISTYYLFTLPPGGI